MYTRCQCLQCRDFPNAFSWKLDQGHFVNPQNTERFQTIAIPFIILTIVIKIPFYGGFRGLPLDEILLLPTIQIIDLFLVRIQITFISYIKRFTQNYISGDRKSTRSYIAFRQKHFPKTFETDSYWAFSDTFGLYNIRSTSHMTTSCILGCFATMKRWKWHQLAVRESTEHGLLWNTYNKNRQRQRNAFLSLKASINHRYQTIIQKQWITHFFCKGKNIAVKLYPKIAKLLKLRLKMCRVVLLLLLFSLHLHNSPLSETLICYIFVNLTHYFGKFGKNGRVFWVINTKCKQWSNENQNIL